MRTLILPIGIPGCGKSTFMEELSETYNIPVVSSDHIRKKLYGDEAIQGDYNKVFTEVYRQVNHWIECGVCILDATHCTRWSRWAAVAKVCPDQVIYIVMDRDVKVAKERNAARERVCPESVIDRMAKNLRKEPPRADECRHLYIFDYDDPALLEFLKEL